MKSYLYIFAITSLLLASSFSTAEIDDRVLVFSKVLEIEAVQKVISQNDYTVITNGTIGHEIEAYIDDVQVSISDGQSASADQLTVQKYEIKSTSARVVISKPNVKVRVKLRKNDGEWKINSYYVKNGKSVSISVDF